MLDFIRIACSVPAVKVGDVKKNAQDICAAMVEADRVEADVILFPEMALTGYTCGDLFFQDALWNAVKDGLKEIAFASGQHPEITAVVGLPVRSGMRVYNCAAVICGGALQMLTSKTYLPNHGESSESRWFSAALSVRETII